MLVLEGYPGMSQKSCSLVTDLFTLVIVIGTAMCTGCKIWELFVSAHAIAAQEEAIVLAAVYFTSQPSRRLRLMG